MFAVHLLLLVTLSCLVSRFGRLQLHFPHFESDEPFRNYSLLLDMTNILQIIRSFPKPSYFSVAAVDTSLRLLFEQVRVQVGDTINILPSALLTMAKLGSLVKYRHFYTFKKVLPLCHLKNPWVNGQYGQHKERNNISKVCPSNYTVSRFHEI